MCKDEQTDVLNTQGDSLHNTQEDNQDIISEVDFKDSPWTSCLVFIQVLLFSLTWVYVWFYPHYAQLGTFTWRPALFYGYLSVIAAGIVVLFLLIFVLPRFIGKIRSYGIVAASILTVYASSVIFLFILIFTFTTMGLISDVNLPSIDPFPFLRWVKFLL